jgi:hypothetical protein
VCLRICRGSNLGHTAKRLFAVGQAATTRHKYDARQTRVLPCAAHRTHGKLPVCRELPSAKIPRSAKRQLPSPHQPAVSTLPSARWSHTAKIEFAVCLLYSTRQRLNLPCACSIAHGNAIFAVCRMYGTRQNEFPFFIYCPSIFFYSLKTTFGTPC